MRISGLATGLDIDGIVSDLMRAERMPLEKLQQEKTYTEWQRDDYREVNKMLLELDDLIFSGIGRQSTFIQKDVSVSNSDALDIRNVNATSDFSGSIQINQLAKAASMRSLAPTSITDPSAKLSDAMGTDEQTIVIKAIKEDGTMQTNEEAFKLTFDPAEETLQSVLGKINSGSGVSAFYDEFTGQVSVTAKNTGLNANGVEIELTQPAGSAYAGSFWDVVNLNSSNQKAVEAGVGSRGENAKFSYNGLETERASNTFTINGVELNLKQTTTGEVSFNSTADTDKIVENITKFVDKYNEFIEFVNGKVSEKRNREFQPLTNEQRESMSEKQVELWEEKARSGTLRGDSVLSGALNQMRSNLYSPVSGIEGAYSQLTQIGITTSSNYRDGGKLIIDEEKLREAISEDPNSVYELFNKNSDSSEAKGLADRLRDTASETMRSIEQKAGKEFSTNETFVLGRNLRDMDSRIADFEARLIDTENRYYRQFTAMETAIQRMGQQSAYLAQQFGGGM